MPIRVNFSVNLNAKRPHNFRTELKNSDNSVWGHIRNFARHTVQCDILMHLQLNLLNNL